MTIHIKEFGTARYGNGKLVWESNSKVLRFELATLTLTIPEAGLESFADAFDDALGRPKRKKAKTK